MANETLETPLIGLKGKNVLPFVRQTLDLGREKSLNAASLNAGRKIFFAAQLDSKAADYTPDSVYKSGTVARIISITQLTRSSIRLEVEGLCRAQMISSTGDDVCYYVLAQTKPYEGGEPMVEEAYFRYLSRQIGDMVKVNPRIDKTILEELTANLSREQFIFRVISKLKMPFEKTQKILESRTLTDVMTIVCEYLEQESQIGDIERKISASVKQSIDKNQKEYYLREQLKAIHTELGDDAEERDVLEEQIKAKHMPAEIEEKTLKELSKMSRMSPTSPDYNVLRGYIDWMCDLPWNEYTKDTEKLSDAVEVLNNDHYGLEKVKERITEYLAVLKLTDGLNAPILCLVGPPGVGKTSIAESVARSLGRKFVRMSLGGVKDEAEIRGHRKTYVGAMPGRIINALKNAGSNNPVFLLDEIDKLSSDMRGDPASALLEVLDPAQNSTFRDRYLEVPYDLSKVLFITTANSLDTIPAPLRDRMEIISIEGYTQEEKREIAKRYLVPKRLKANGLEKGDITFSDGAIEEIISGYTMEAGVRSLERQIDAVCRKAAVKKAVGKAKKIKLNETNVEKYLGSRRFERKANNERDEVGAATGLAWTAVGGTTLTIEVSAMHGKGDVQLTGKLGDVMKESARAAISYIRSRSEDYGIDGDAFETTDIHVHVPEGATPKDGPSAGITMATAILSAFTGKPVRHDVAMTGEITLRGKVLPIGGLKEKALAAYRVGIKDVIIPEDNEKDLEEIPEDVKSKLNFIPVNTVDTVFKNAIIGL